MTPYLRHKHQKQRKRSAIVRAHAAKRRAGARAERDHLQEIDDATGLHQPTQLAERGVYAEH